MMPIESMTADEAASEYRKLDVYACCDVDPIIARLESDRAALLAALEEIADDRRVPPCEWQSKLVARAAIEKVRGGE